CGPGSVLHLWNVSAEIRPDTTLLSRIDDQSVVNQPGRDSQAREAEQRAAEILAADVLDRDRAVGHGRQSDERRDLDVIGTDRHRRATEWLAALDLVGVRPDAVDPGAH